MPWRGRTRSPIPARVRVREVLAARWVRALRGRDARTEVHRQSAIGPTRLDRVVVTSFARRLLGTVLHLPGVVQDVPGNAARRITQRPSLRAQRAAVGGLAEHCGDRHSYTVDGLQIAQGRLSDPHTDLAGI